jgi:hypothetical protein
MTIAAETITNTVSIWQPMTMQSQQLWNTTVAPGTLSVTKPVNPPTEHRINCKSKCSLFPLTIKYPIIKVIAINTAPNKKDTVPARVILPERPLHIGFHVIMETGVFWLNTPSSDPQRCRHLMKLWRLQRQG